MARVLRDEVAAYLDGFLSAGEFADYGPNGIQVEGAEEISRVVTGVSASVALFREAVRRKADAVLVHHGIFWDRDSRVLRGGLRERVRILLENDITLLAYHLPLDRHPQVGNNASAGRLLGLKEPAGFGELGIAGTVDSLTIAELTDRVRGAFGREPLVFASGPPRIRRVGFCSGAAPGEVGTAISAGLDAYITGEVSLPVMHAAREGHIHFLAAGHYATEVPGIRALGDNLRERFGLEVEFVDIPNPV